MWCVGADLPTGILFVDKLFYEPLGIMIPCLISLCTGLILGFFGPFMLRDPIQIKRDWLAVGIAHTIADIDEMETHRLY